MTVEPNPDPVVEMVSTTEMIVNGSAAPMGLRISIEYDTSPPGATTSLVPPTAMFCLSTTTVGTTSSTVTSSWSDAEPVRLKASSTEAVTTSSIWSLSSRHVSATENWQPSDPLALTGSPTRL